MKSKEILINSITDSFQMITIHLKIDRFVPRGLICDISKHLSKLNNFVLSELHVLLKLIVIQLEENCLSKLRGEK